MRQSEGYLIDSDKVLLLKKAKYGLKQSGRAWNENISSVLDDWYFIACDNEPCLYKRSGRSNLSLILVYVEDILIAFQTQMEYMYVNK